MFTNEKGMERNKIGFAIQYFREKYNISQSTLCKGLCSVATLSRIEAGEREADGLLLETILERMGKTPNKFELVLTEVDYESFQKRDEIEKLIETKDYKVASEMLLTYKKLTNTKGNVHKQFIIRTEARLNELQGGSTDKTIDLLTEAISYTVPGFKTNEIKELYLSQMELNIIIDIAGRMLLIDMKSRAKEILLQVLDYLELHYSLEIINELYPKVAIIACEMFIQEQDYSRALEICDKGMEKNKSNRKLDYRGELSFIKARVTEELIRKQDDWEIKQKEFLKWYLQAYYVFDFCGESVKAQEIKVYLQGEYSWVNID
jgi:transcriptional regulator with XRE-family HTH domain